MARMVGELRCSQAVHTFGVGGHIDLPHFTAIVMGLDSWRLGGWDPLGPAASISEPRLLGLVRNFLGEQVKQLTALPVSDPEMEFADRVGVPLATFPRWFRCPRCEIAAPLDQGLFKLKTVPNSPGRTKYIHETCPKAQGGRPPEVAPVRFVVACRNGHLDDFPWKRFLSEAGCGNYPGCGKSVYLQERGVAAEVADLWVKCGDERCGASRQMIHAFGENAANAIGPCTKKHPHFGQRYCAEECNDGEPRTMLLGASNQWFSVMASALSIPVDANELAGLVTKHWTKLESIESQAELVVYRRIGELAKAGIDSFSDEEIWSTLESHRSEDDEDAQTRHLAQIKDEEWALFSDWESAASDRDFKLRGVGVPRGFETLIEEVVAVDRLRLVKALTAFTRIDSPGDYRDISEIPDVKRVPLSTDPPEWVPSYEVRGEGLFVRLNEQAIDAWAQEPSVQARMERLGLAYARFREVRTLEPDPEMDVIRYTLLHTLSHLLIRQLSVECGYSAASVQERIYSRGPEEDGGPQAGILLMTAAADSQGTLGGLVELSSPSHLGRHLSGALERAMLCASDPLCSEHEPLQDGRTLHGASCHACGFISETSCERGNKFLDRALLVPVVGAEVTPFFKDIVL